MLAHVARLAATADAEEIAGLLDAFNREFDAPTPGPQVLAGRLTRLLSASTTFAVLVDAPATGVALVTLRPNVWTDGTVALLDELYVVPAGRNAGRGAALLRLATAEAGRRGATEFEVEVDEPDADAIRFYGRYGLPHRDPDTGDRALVLRRDLRRK